MSTGTRSSAPTDAEFNILGGGLNLYSDNTFDSNMTFLGAGFLSVNTGTVVIQGNSPNFTGTTYVEDQSTDLQVDGSLPGTFVDVGEGGTLSGTGTVGAISDIGIALSPGDGGQPGILTADGNVTIESESVFNVALDGTTAGTGYGELDAKGSVDLGGSTLTGTLGFTPTAGESFTIIQSTAPISGTFGNIAEGGPVTIGGVPFSINYAGGPSGDDVVLTSMATSATTTTTTLTPSASPATLGQSVTFTADVSSSTGTPSGSVTFTIDGRPQPPVALAVVNGVDQATFTTPALGLGPHTINAAYGGNTSFASSMPTNPLTLLIEAPTTMNFGSSGNPSREGQPVTLTATVTALGGAGAPTGSVSFEEGSTVLKTVSLDSSGQATYTTTSLPPGSDPLTALYSPTGYFLPAPSQGFTQLVYGLSLAPTQPVGKDGPRITLMQRARLPHDADDNCADLRRGPRRCHCRGCQGLSHHRSRGPAIAIKKAVYYPPGFIVTLYPVERINIHHRYTMIVDGTGSHGVTSTSGIARRRGYRLSGQRLSCPARPGATWCSILRRTGRTGQSNGTRHSK